MFKPPLQKRNQLSPAVQLSMTADKQYSLSTSILSSLIGLVIGISIFILLNLFIKVVIYCTKRQHGPDMNMGIEHESHTPNTPLHPLANYTRRPAFTTVETMPGHALSDMDRDIKLQTANCQDLRTLKQQYLGYTGDSDLITHGH